MTIEEQINKTVFPGHLPPPHTPFTDTGALLGKWACVCVVCVCVCVCVCVQRYSMYMQFTYKPFAPMNTDIANSIVCICSLHIHMCTYIQPFCSDEHRHEAMHMYMIRRHMYTYICAHTYKPLALLERWPWWAQTLQNVCIEEGVLLLQNVFSYYRMCSLVQTSCSAWEMTLMNTDITAREHIL